MQTDKIKVNDKGEGREEALREVARFSEYMGLDRKSQLRLELLAEETLGMVSAITGEFEAEFWIEGQESSRNNLNSFHPQMPITKAFADGRRGSHFAAVPEKDNVCRIHLMANTLMDYNKKQELIEASSSKKNAASNGFMGKVLEIFENSAYSMNEITALQVEYGGAPLMYGTMGMNDAVVLPSVSYMWSLGKYRENVDNDRENDEAAVEAWDELEKSIVANIADDVTVAVRGDSVELVIEKKF